MLANEKGSIELIVMGLLAALILVLAIPMLGKIGNETNKSLGTVYNDMKTANDEAAAARTPAAQ